MTAPHNPMEIACIFTFKISHSVVNVNQNDIRPDLADIFERNHDIRLAIQEIKHLVAPGNHNLADTSAAGVKLQITHPSQFPAILDVDDILTFQFRIKHPDHPFLDVFIITNMQTCSK